jgi:dihydropteroate synthase
MYDRAVYGDVVRDVARELEEAVDRGLRGGVRRDAIILDPGFGFAKRPEHSLRLLARLNELLILDRPLLSGPSRKSFLQDPLSERAPAEREWGTAAAVSASILLGAHIVRVHNVAAMVDVARVADRLLALT